jgi:EAL domain-containing protein (putative c-di-GMP-specific phosphodiesterase class I)
MNPAEARILLVKDESMVGPGVQRRLDDQRLAVACAESGAEALEMLSRDRFDVVVSDESVASSQMLSILRQSHPEIVRIVLSRQAGLDAALRAINSVEICRFLLKPSPPEEISLTIMEALAVREERRLLDGWKAERADRGVLSRDFDRVIEGMRMGYQPIVRAWLGDIVGYEALLRNEDPEWCDPRRVLTAALALGRMADVGRRIRALVASDIDRAPPGATIFVNASPSELEDELFLAGHDGLAEHARRVVIEVTERDSLTSTSDLALTAERLRKVGYRIAVDDLGAGSAGLASVVLIMPDLVKFDISLVRSIHSSPTKQKLVRGIADVCRDLRIGTLAEGIETADECDVVSSLGCDLLQGFYFGAAARDFQGASTVSFHYGG